MAYTLSIHKETSIHKKNRPKGNKTSTLQGMKQARRTKIW